VPKNIAGQDEEIPLKMLWGTFCRQVVVDAASGQEPTLVGILNGVDVNIETPKKQEKYEVPLQLWLHAVFKVEELTDDDRVFKISVKFSLENGHDVIQEINVPNKAGKEFIDLNMSLPMMQRGYRLVLPEGKSLLKMSFRYSTHRLGMVELPIKVIVNQIGEGPDVSAATT